MLGLRVQAIHRNADRARVESETLRTRAHTDVLTGLPNRRGLSDHIQAALQRVGPQRMLAVARALGQKLLAAFEPPFDVAGQRCAVGLTVGCALAPLDGHSADELLRRDDAAKYAGKQRGGRQLQRGGRAMVGVSSVTA